MKKYTALLFREFPDSEYGKIIDVRHIKDYFSFGHIRWHPTSERFLFFPSQDCEFTEDQLLDIINKIKELEEDK